MRLRTCTPDAMVHGALMLLLTIWLAVSVEKKNVV
jgi:hypothetical protein